MMSTEPSYHLSLNFIYGMHVVHDYYLVNNLSKTYPLNEYMCEMIYALKPFLSEKFQVL